MAISDRLSRAIQRKGVRVSVVSTNSTQPAMIADELRRQADEFIDLIHLASKVGRDPSERIQRYQDRRPAIHAPHHGTEPHDPVDGE